MKQHHVIGGKGSINEVAGNVDHVGVELMIGVPGSQYRYRWYTNSVPFAPYYPQMYVHSGNGFVNLARKPSRIIGYSPPLRQFYPCFSGVFGFGLTRYSVLPY